MSFFANLRFDGALVSDIGTKREKNQDYGLCLPEEGLFVVADGMGGHQGGEIASKICVETLHQVLADSAKDGEPASETLIVALRTANRAIYEKSLQDPSLKGMGTTLTALQVRGQHATILQVGDSRAYFWNRSGIWQITRDHSYVQEKIRAGLIHRDQEKTDEMRNFITRSVGYELDVSGDLFGMAIEDGGRVPSLLGRALGSSG